MIINYLKKILNKNYSFYLFLIRVNMKKMLLKKTFHKGLFNYLVIILWNQISIINKVKLI